MKHIALLLIIFSIALTIGCTQQCSMETPEACDKSCETTEDCEYSCGCGCISKEETCGTDCVNFMQLPCECREGKCITVEPLTPNLTKCETASDCEDQPVANQWPGEWACIDGRCEYQEYPHEAECETDEDCSDIECKIECENGTIEKYCLKGKCFCNCPSEESRLEEFHEWGVIVGCTTNDNMIVTSRPEQQAEPYPIAVKQPVIYLHAEKPTQAYVEVGFPGNPTETYPQAEIDSNTPAATDKIPIVWNEVFVDGCESKALKPLGKAMVPLESIMDELNDVDADCLSYNNIENNFLFYEGLMNFQSNINLTINENKLTIKNNRDKPIHNVHFVQENKVFSWEKISAGQGIVFDMNKPQTAIALPPKESMEKMGFTEKEALAFENVWNENFFNPENANKQLIFRLDQEEYDQMFPLYVEPKPQKTVRAMYVLLEVD